MGNYKKLAYRYCGPFEILQRLGEQFYKLALPPHLHVHNVFHVNLLKKYVPSAEHVLDLDDNVLVNQEEFQMEPEQILEMKEKQLRNRTVREVLVQWKGYPLEDASWEDWSDYLCNFLISKVDILGYLSFGNGTLYLWTWKIIDAICISFGLIE